MGRLGSVWSGEVRRTLESRVWTWLREFVPLKHKNAGIRWRDSTNLPWICQISPLDSVYSRATWPIYLSSIRLGNPWPRFWSYSGHDNSKLNSIPVQRSKIQFRREIIANNCSMNLTFWPTCKIIRKEKSQESILLIIFINVTQGELVNFERNFHQVVYKVASLLSGRQFWKEFTYPDLNKRIATWKLSKNNPLVVENWPNDQKTYLSQIKIDKVLGLVGNVTAKVAANNAVPGWAEKINK